jgi:hypothetical protein
MLSGGLLAASIKSVDNGKLESKKLCLDQQGLLGNRVKIKNVYREVSFFPASAGISSLSQ